MKPVMQTVFSNNDPVNPVYGNCWAACLASILEVSVDEVPEFNAGDQMDSTGAWLRKTNIWLATKGLAILEVSSLPPEDYAHLGIGLYHIITGPSPRGPYQHAVVGRNSKIVHDPHPDNTGLRNGSWLHAIFIKTFI